MMQTSSEKTPTPPVGLSNTTARHDSQSWLSRGGSETLRQIAPIATLLILVIVVGIITPEFLSVKTLLTLAGDTATLFVLAAGVTFVIMLGGIDLSIESAASFCSVVVAMSLPYVGYLSFFLGALAGAGIGLVNGLLHTRLKIPSFITTLAAMGVWSGVALVITDVKPIQIELKNTDYLLWISGKTVGVPNTVFIGVAVLLVCLFIQRYTAFGRYSTAIGAGEEATWAAGVNVSRHKIIAFMLSGTMAGLAGVMLSGIMSGGSARMADNLLLPTIASVIVGGTAITGGVGSVVRTVIGALIISVVRVGMQFIGVDVFAQQIVFGVMLVIAVAITIDRSKIPIVK
jgi:ribose transport system permease protein